MRLAPERLSRFVPPRLAAALGEEAVPEAAQAAAWPAVAVLALEVRGLLPLVPAWAERLAEHADDELGWVWRSTLGPLVEGVARGGGEVLLVRDDLVVGAWPAAEERPAADGASALAQALHRAARCGLTLARRFAAHRPDPAHPVRARLHLALGSGELRWGCAPAAGLWLGGEALGSALGGLGPGSRPGSLRLDAAAAAALRPADAAALQVDPASEGHRLLAELAPLALAEAPSSAPAERGPRDPEPLCCGLVRATMDEDRLRDPERLVRATVASVRSPARSAGPELLDALATLARDHGGLCGVPLLLEEGLRLDVRFGLTRSPRAVPAEEALAFAVEATRREPSLAVGLASGPLFCTPISSGARGGVVAAGPATARAAALARLGGVHMDAATELTVGPGIARSPGPELQGQPSFAVAARDASEAAAEQAEGRLFGRSAELARLARGLDAVEGGISSVLFLEGEAGIGKTRLVEAARELARARGLEVWVSGARAEGRADAWHAWRGVAEALFGLDPRRPARERRARVHERLGPERVALAPLLNPLLSLELTESPETQGLEGRARAQQAEDLLIGLLDEAAAREPLVLVVEDAHWFDEASWSLTLQVSQRVRPLFLLVTSRPLPEPPPRLAQRLFDTLATTHWVLDALSVLGTRQLLARTLGTAEVPEALAAWVHGRSEGNPFASEELAHALVELGAVEVSEGVLVRVPSPTELEELPLPPALGDVVAQRIARLPERQQALLGAASIIGPVFGLNALRDVHPLEHTGGPVHPDGAESLGEDLEALRVADLAHAAGESESELFAFKHQITLEAAYAGMPSAQRRAAHAALARHLEARDAGRLAPHYPALAHHWEQAGDLPRALEYLELAGEQAVRQGACTEAMAHLERARSLYRQARPDGVDRVRRARWARLLADAALGLGRMDAVSQHATEALVLLELPVPRGRLARVGLLAWEALRHLYLLPLWGLWSPPEGSAKRARRVEGALASMRLSRAQYFTLELLDFVTSCFRAANLGTLAGRDAPVSSTYAMLGMLAGSLRLGPLGRFYLARADRIAVLLDDRGEQAFNHQLRALYHLGFGAWGPAAEHGEQALLGFAEVSDRDGEQIGHTILGMVAFFQGRLEEAHERFAMLVASARLTGNRQHEAWGIYSVARVQALQGVLDEPVERLHAALDLLDGIEDPASRAICWATLGLVHCRRGEWRRAQECADRAGQLCWEGQPSTVAVIDALWQMTEAHQRLLRHQEARAEAGREVLERACARGLVALRRFSRMFPMGRPYLAVAEARAAVVAGSPDASRLVEEAVRHAAEAGCRHQEARAVELRGWLDPAAAEGGVA